MIETGTLLSAGFISTLQKVINERNKRIIAKCKWKVH
jgi:hypothetical protein